MRGELLDTFRSVAAQRPDAPAFTFVGTARGPYTFGELFARADELAARLKAHELTSDAPVGLLLRSQEDQVLHYLGALAAGLVPAILTPPNPKLNREYYAATMNAVLARCRFAAVVTDIEGIEIPAPRLRPHDIEASGRAAVDGGPPRGPALDAAFLQFSSGTTGIKRGVPIADRAALEQIRTYGEAIRLDDRDVIVSWLPLYHDMGFVACLNMPLAHGVHTVMIDPIAWVTRPSIFLRTASEHGGTLAWNPNFAYAFMAQRVPKDDVVDVDLSTFRGLVNCSEPVTHVSQSAFYERFASHGLDASVFWGCYAMAETTFALTHGTPSDPLYLDSEGPQDASLRAPFQVSVGHALPGVELQVVSEEGQILPERRVGELRVRSPFSFTGYYNDLDATEAAISDGWYRTGDMGYRVGDAFYVIDRKKDVMIVGGVNVFPADVEELVSGIDGVVPGRVSAFSDFDPRLETERIVVLFESTLEDDESLSRVVIEARQRILAAFQVANFGVHAIPPGWLVKSSAGKISRSANREKWRATNAPTQLGKPA